MQRRELIWLAAMPLVAGKRVEVFDGKTLGGWVSEGGKPQQWVVEGGLLKNGPAGKVNNLVSEREFGDVEVEVEFRIPKGSNSGVYLMGLYEVQIFDSFGKEKITTQDGGSIYHRWIDGKPVGGSVARLNAAKAPGEWQRYRIVFRAPRFRGGKKTENARFERVEFNGVLVQERVECEGPTRSAMAREEGLRGPLMIQGDHGPVEFRRILARER